MKLANYTKSVSVRAREGEESNEGVMRGLRMETEIARLAQLV